MFSALGLWDETGEQEARHDEPLQPERAHSARQSPGTDAAHERAALSQPAESASPVTDGWSAIQTVWEAVSKASATIGEVFDMDAADEPAPAATSPEEPRTPRRAALSTPPALRGSTPPAAAPLGCGGAGRSPRWEGPATLLFAGLSPADQESPRPRGAVRESGGARRVQWRKTASCLSSGGTRSHEETSDRVQRPARRSDRRCRGSGRERSRVHVAHVDSSRPPASRFV